MAPRAFYREKVVCSTLSLPRSGTVQLFPAGFQDSVRLLSRNQFRLWEVLLEKKTKNKKTFRLNSPNGFPKHISPVFYRELTEVVDPLEGWKRGRLMQGRMKRWGLCRLISRGRRRLCTATFVPLAGQAQPSCFYASLSLLHLCFIFPTSALTPFNQQTTDEMRISHSSSGISTLRSWALNALNCEIHSLILYLQKERPALSAYFLLYTYIHSF